MRLVCGVGAVKLSLVGGAVRWCSCYSWLLQLLQLVQLVGAIDGGEVAHELVGWCSWLVQLVGAVGWCSWLV